MTGLKNKRIRTFIMVVIFSLTYLLSVSALKSNETYASLTGTVTGTNVNVRTGPGASYGKITQLNTNDKVTVLDTIDTADDYDWYQIGFYYDGNYIEGYITSQFVSIDEVYEEDKNFEEWLNTQGFPESYKPYLRQLHASYPQWVFYADHIDYDFDYVVEQEHVGSRSLISSRSITSWKSLDTTAYNWETGEWYGFDGPSWVKASKELVAYALDPRNFLDLSHVFMFETLSNDANSHVESGVKSIISGTFMSRSTIEGGQSYSSALMQAARDSGVSPYHLAVRIIQEMGTNGTSGSISGSYGGYQGLYNYYNIGAYTTGDASAIENGLKFARNKGWTSRMKAISGGASYIGTNYINIGQDTLYYQKFDFVGTPFTHQYMTHVIAHRSEAERAVNAYDSSILKQNRFSFSIPVFNDMPSEVVSVPTGDGDPNNILKSLEVDGYSLTPSFGYFTESYDLIVGSDVDSVNISAEKMSSNASVSGDGRHSLEIGMNVIELTVEAGDGSTRTYTINIVREAPPLVDYISSSQYRIDHSSGIISGIELGTEAGNLLSKVNVSQGYTVKLFNASGAVKSGKVCTGDRLVVYNGSGKVVKEYSILLYGDANGDGTIDALDLLYLKRHILNYNELPGVYAKAADVTRNGDGIDALDLLYIKRDIMGIKSIQQR